MRVDLGTQGLQAADIAPTPRFRYVPWSSGGPSLLDKGHRPRILVTLGTFDPPKAGQTLREIATSAAETGAEVIIVQGNSDHALLTGQLPAGVLVVDWLDMSRAVRTCDLVVHHGGAGTSWATLSAGTPAVVIPQMGDQFRNARLLADAHVGVYVDGTTSLTSTLQQALEDQSLGMNAASIAADNHALPATTELVALLEQVTAHAAERWLRPSPPSSTM